MEIITDSASKTVAAGRALAKALEPGDIVCLYGDLGTGKTVLARGISLGLGGSGCAVLSPTFVLMRCHAGRIPMYHFDLYRVGGPEDILGLGYEEFFFSDGVSVIEWAERLGYLTPAECLRVELEHLPGMRRRLRFIARGQRYRELLEKFSRGYAKVKGRARVVR